MSLGPPIPVRCTPAALGHWEGLSRAWLCPVTPMPGPEIEPPPHASSSAEAKLQGKMAAKQPPPLMKKHSQTDLVSRLKTRKILGVGGEDDDGEVHRSKVGQGGPEPPGGGGAPHWEGGLAMELSSSCQNPSGVASEP